MNLFIVLTAEIRRRENGQNTITVGGHKDGPRDVLFLDGIVDRGFEVGQVDSGLLFGVIGGLRSSYVLKSLLTNRKVRNQSENQFVMHQTARAASSQCSGIFVRVAKSTLVPRSTLTSAGARRTQAYR
jgi:hypothetical protein